MRKQFNDVWRLVNEYLGKCKQASRQKTEQNVQKKKSDNQRTRL